MFHVKHASLPDAKVPENHVQHVLDIDPAGQPLQSAGGKS
jgi:hypothetical protein